MAAKSRLSVKRLQIDKATTTIVLIISLATAIVVFSLTATRALLSQRSYYSRVIAQKEEANNRLEANIKAKDALVESYKQFVNRPQNVIGGDPQGQGQNDGDNARIILDALPSKYDFPAMATSYEKLLSDPQLGIKIMGLTGSDDELAQNEAVVDSPQPVEIPFSLSLSGSYGSVEATIEAIERSIRPTSIKTLSMSGTDTSMTVNISAITYYQPEKTINIRVEEIQ